jgi:hypothetical protein
MPKINNSCAGKSDFIYLHMQLFKKKKQPQYITFLNTLPHYYIYLYDHEFY